MLEKAELSKKDWFENLISDEKRNFGNSYRSGKRLGREEAEEKYVVKYPCNVCGQNLRVRSEEEKEACREALSTWGHSSCHS